MSTTISAISNNSASRIGLDEREVAYDLVFVINANSRGWILEKVCRVIDKYSDLHCGYIFTEKNDTLTVELPKARAYFFSHYSLAYWAAVKHRQIFGADRFVYFTHPDANKGISFDELAAGLNAMTHVFAMNTELKALLSLIGVRQDKLSVPIGGADPDVFHPHKRGGGKVGFVSAFYPRKLPDKMIDVIRAMPDVEFLLVGPTPQSVANQGILWRNWSRYDEMLALPNLVYVEAEYEDYPSLFDQMDVYVSLSQLEGGPIPVLEAMMANVIPVATRTGFASDVISNGKNGHIIAVDADEREIESAIREALEDTETDIRSSGLMFTWERLAQEMLRKIQQPAIFGRTISLTNAQAPKAIFRDGWHAPEPNGTWTSKGTAELAVRLRSVGTGRKRLVMKCWTLPQPPDKRTTVRVSVNGRWVVDEVLTTEAPTELSGDFEIPPESIDAPLRIGIEVSPVLEPSNDDEDPEAGEVTTKMRPERDLGVKVGWLRIDDHLAVELGQGSEVHFSHGGLGAPLLQDGWYPIEPEGVWTNGPTGTVTLPPLEGVGNGWSRMEVRGRVLARDGRAPTIVVSALLPSGESRQLAKIDFNGEAFKTFEVPLKDTPINEGATIVFTASDCIQPAEIFPDSADLRPLGFFLQSMKLSHGNSWAWRAGKKMSQLAATG